MRKQFIFTTILFISFLFSCDKIIDLYPKPGKGNPLKNYSNQVILDWNQAVVEAMGGVSYQHGPLGARIHAMTHIAMHDALNAIVPAYETYAFKGNDHAAHPIAALASAAYTVLVNSLPHQKAMLDTRLTQSLVDIKEGEGKTKGIELGKKAALAILDLRKNDGAFADPIGKVELSDKPGVYQDDFAFAPFWKTMKLFSMESHNQFRSDPPPPLNSQAYTKDFNEIKSIGKKDSHSRTPDQTAIAHYWYELMEIYWNRVTRTIVESRKPDLLTTARLFALLNIALADGYTAGWDSKFHYNFWRPIKAIPAAQTDGNSDTKADPAWRPLMPTPPIPDHPSTHAALGNAAATILGHMFGDQFNFTASSSTALKEGEKRSFSSFGQAADENADSRVFAGIHWRFATDAGQEQGNKLGNWVINNELKLKHQ